MPCRPRRARRRARFFCSTQSGGSDSRHCCYRSRRGHHAGRSAARPIGCECRRAFRPALILPRRAGAAAAASRRTRRPGARFAPAGPRAVVQHRCHKCRLQRHRTRRSGAGPRPRSSRRRRASGTTPSRSNTSFSFRRPGRPAMGDADWGAALAGGARQAVHNPGSRRAAGFRQSR